MSENTTNKNVRDDEIDLLDLFRRMGNTIGRWLNALGKAILISIVFMLRRWLPLGLSIIAGVGISYLLKYTNESFFSSDMVLRNNTVSNSDMIAYINKLHVYAEEDNITALAEALDLDDLAKNNVLDITAYWVIDQSRDGIPDYVDYRANHNVYDTINIRMQDRLDIRVQVKSPQDLTLVRNGILTYINSDSLFQQRNRVRLRQNLEMLARLDYDILQLDSLQKLKLQETKTIQPKLGNQMIFLQEQKTQLLYTDIYPLYTRKQSLEVERDLYKGIVTVLSEFSIPAKRDNGGLYYAKKYIPIFFFLTLLLLILIANRKKIEETFKKY